MAIFNRRAPRRSIVFRTVSIRARRHLVTVDALGGLPDGVRARGAFVLRLSLDPPWSMRIQDEAPLTLICMTHGEAVLVCDAGDTLVVRPGDVAVAKGVGASAATGKSYEHYLFADD